VLYLYFVPFIGFQIKYDDDDDDTFGGVIVIAKRVNTAKSAVKWIQYSAEA